MLFLRTKNTLLSTIREGVFLLNFYLNLGAIFTQISTCFLRKNWGLCMAQF